MSDAQIEIQIIDQPIAPFGPPPDGCGAAVEFAGIVRGLENGAPIAALEYQAYKPMAELELSRLIRDLLTELPCASVRVTHRIGVVPVGEAAIRLQVSASHRAEAFSLAEAFMDRLKQAVPIWKVGTVPR